MTARTLPEIMARNALPFLDHSSSSIVNAFLVSLPITGALWGVQLAETYKYFRRYKNDPTGLKCLVISLFVLQTAYFIAQTASFHRVLFVLLGEIPSSNRPSHIQLVVLSLKFPIVLLSNGYFIVRAYKVTRRRFIKTAALILFGIAELFILAYIICMFISHWSAQLPRLQQLMRIFLLVGVWGYVVVGLYLVLALSSEIYNDPNRGFKTPSAVDMFTRLVHYGFRTAACMTLINLASAIALAFTTRSATIAGVAVNQVVSGMSVVCVIYTLNVRRYLREWEEPENDPSMWRGDAPRVPPPPIPVAKKSNNTWLSWQGMRTAGITREDVLTEQSKAFTEASFNDAAFDVLESVEPAQLGPKRKTREFHSTGSGTSMSTTASLQA